MTYASTRAFFIKKSVFSVKISLLSAFNFQLSTFFCTFVPDFKLANYRLMITIEQLKDVQQRADKLKSYLQIDEKRIQLEEEELHTQAPGFWDDAKAAEAQMRKVKGIKRWIEGYEGVRAAVEELTLAFDYYKEDLVSEDEVDAAYAHALQEVEDLEMKNMLSHEEDQMPAVLKIVSGAGGTEAQDWAEQLMRMYLRYCEKHDYKVTIENLQEGDEAAYRYGLTLRGTERGVQAQADARVAGLKTNLKRLSEVTGVTLSREATPETYRLLEIYYASLARTTHHMKQTFLRPRPVEVYPEDKGCLPEQRLSKGSYPSGHSARSWAAALAVATLLPQQAERILRAGYELGESRWICGPHWRSDVEAGRLAATSVLTRLLAEESFLIQLRRAQAEIKAQTVK